MDVNERGTKKWTSLMLPEHVQMLEELDQEQDRKEKPVLDEQMITENYMVMEEALRSDLKIRIKYYADYDYKYHEGFLLSVDTINMIVFMEEININLDDVLEVHIL